MFPILSILRFDPLEVQLLYLGNHDRSYTVSVDRGDDIETTLNNKHREGENEVVLNKSCTDCNYRRIKINANSEEHQLIAAKKIFVRFFRSGVTKPKNIGHLRSTITRGQQRNACLHASDCTRCYHCALCRARKYPCFFLLKYANF